MHPGRCDAIAPCGALRKTGSVPHGAAAFTHRGVRRPGRGGAEGAQFAAGQGTPAHLVRAVGQACRGRVRPELGQHEVLAHPGGAVHLDRLVEDPLHSGRCGNLDGLDLGVRTSL